MNLAEMLEMADKATQDVEINTTEFTLVTPGVYDVAITSAEGPLESSRTNPNNPSEHGQYIRIECTIIGPSFANRKVWMNNNIICFPRSMNDDDVKKAQTAMAMGAKERKIILDSIGKAGISDVDELVGASFKANIVIEKGTNGYKDKNVIKSIRPSSGQAEQAKQVASQKNEDAPKPATSRPKMPWEK